MLTEVLSQEPNLTYAYRIQNTDVMHSIWKSPKILHLSFSILPFPTIFCPIDIYLSGSTVWPQALGFQKWTIFGIFNKLHCGMRLFFHFLNTVAIFGLE